MNNSKSNIDDKMIRKEKYHSALGSIKNEELYRISQSKKS